MRERGGPSQFEITHYEESDITVVGSGPIGDKAARLLEETPRAREVGFKTPTRAVIANDVINSWLQTAGIGTGIEELTPEQGLALTTNQRLHDEIVGTLGKVEITQSVPMALLARSSGPSDRRGVGVHESAVSLSNNDFLAQAVKRVLAGYTTTKARIHREKVGGNQGYGIMVEPMVGILMGSAHDKDIYFAPPLSGYGETTAPDEPRGYIAAVPGFGGGVISGAHIFRPNDWSLVQGSMTLALMFERLDIHAGRRPYRGSNLLQNKHKWNMPNMHFGDAVRLLHDGDSDGSVQNEVPLTYSSFYEHGDKTVNLAALYKMAQRLAAGRRLYYEWAAITYEGLPPDYFLTQAGELNMPIDDVDFSNSEGLFSEGIAVVGTGERVSHNGVILRTKEDYELFNSSGFNDVNTGYSVFMSPQITEGATSSPLELTEFSNAIGIFEWTDTDHLHRLPVEGHYKGRLDEYGITLGVLQDEPELPVENEGGLSIHRGDFLIRASQTRQRLALHRIAPEEK